MFRRFALSRAFCVLAALVCASFLLGPSTARAQDTQIDWETAGFGSLTPFPSGTTVTSVDGTSATVTWSTQTEGTGTFQPAFGGAFLAYYTGTIGSGVNPLIINFDNSSYDPRDKVTVTITLSRAVTNLRFSLSDIDNGNFADAIAVGYDNDNSGGFTNAATNTAFWTAGLAVTRTNNATVDGWRGTANSSQTSTNGDLAFNFGSQAVQRIQIVYFSYTGSGDPGTQYASLSDLTFTASTADLSLTKQLIGTAPYSGGSATWRLTVTNASASTATANGIIVADTLPASFTFTGSSGTGSFNSTTGQWSVGSLAPGASASIDITGTISASAGATVTNIAEIIASSALDPDSTPNNGATGEDDYATASFTVPAGRPAGVPPVLSCPAGVSVFDWDAITGWSAGSTDNSYAFSTFGNIRFQLSNDGAFLNNAAFGGQSPTVVNTFTGGVSPAQNSLTVLADQTNQSGEVEITITLPRSFTGLQFTIFDVDFAGGQFADRVEVIGSNAGSTVTPTLTNGNVNYVSGNSAFGDGASDSDQALGNVVVTFASSVDTIIVRYGNYSAAPADPGQQGIGLHDISVCNPSAVLSVTKVSSILSDPVNGSTNPKAIPGALVEYLITVSNTGPDAADADSVVVWDDGPADAKMCLIGRAAGPVIFSDPGGNTGLSYSFTALNSATDDVEFSSDDGSTYSYTPVADGIGCDSAITDFRVRPGGAFAAGSSFTITVRYVVE